MFSRSRRLIAASLTAALTVGLATAVPAQAEDDILARLRHVPGLTVVSESAAPDGFRFFMLTISQPVDHRRPQGDRFAQRFSLLHRSTTRPMSLFTTGYYVPEIPFRWEPTELLDANQISVEHRFFLPSRPEPANWDKLDIWQAASDHHRIVQALKPLYPAKWIATGGSKGGMTSVYHRRFYPNDVAGVVAYVAPNDPHNNEDSAYDRFFETAGTDPACRQRLNDVQREALKRRRELLPRFEALAASKGATFNEIFGSADKAFEMAVLDTRFVFWQYFEQSNCPMVPAATASSDEIYQFVNSIVGWEFYNDEGLQFIQPYYFQAATQLGWPSLSYEHLRGLTHHLPALNDINSSLPPALRRKHDPYPMIDIDFWVRTQASQMLFIYGGNDPWGAERFTPSRRDSYSYTAPGANHVGGVIANLASADRAAATATLMRWANVSASPVPATKLSIDGLDVLNPRHAGRSPNKH